MTASPQPQREYIITEEQLHEIYQQTRDRIGYSCCEDTVRDVRTRPHTPAPEPTMVFPHCIHGVFDESELRTHCLKDSGTCLDWRKCEGRIPRQIPTQKEYIDAFCKFQQDKRDKHDASIARTATLAENKRVLEDTIVGLKSNLHFVCWHKGEACPYIHLSCRDCMIQHLESLRTVAQEVRR
jgi:hypothetical protein